MWDGAGSAFVQVQAAPAALDGGQQQQWPTSLKLEQRQGSQGAAVGLQPANSEGASPRVKTSKPGRGAHPAVCQVCGVSVAALKEYYVMDQMVRSDGEIQRFCQQCGRFHHISAFDDNKRSCRERLARHNERRRRRPVSEPLAGSKRPSGSPADLEASNSGHSIDNSWAQQQHHRPTFMADMPVNYIHPSMDIWQQRQMQLQAMQLQDHQSMAATGSHSLSAPYNIMTSGASNFPSDLGTSHFSDGFAQYSLMGQQSLHQPHSSSHVLTFHSHADANLHAAMPGLSAIAGIPHLPVVPVAAATGAAEHRAPRKTLSWPLMQIKLGDVAAQEQHGLITGASRNFGVHHQTYGDEAMLMMQHAASVLPHGTAVHNDRPFPAPRAGDGMMLHQSEIRVLGENQTLDAILENIMLLDEPDGV